MHTHTQLRTTNYERILKQFVCKKTTNTMAAHILRLNKEDTMIKFKIENSIAFVSS